MCRAFVLPYGCTSYFGECSPLALTRHPGTPKKWTKHKIRANEFRLIQERCAQPRHRALLKRRSLFANLQVSLKVHSRKHRNEHQQRRAIFGNMHHESISNHTRRDTNEQKSWFGRVLGLCGQGLGAQRAQRPAQMHFK